MKQSELTFKININIFNKGFLKNTTTFSALNNKTSSYMNYYIFPRHNYQRPFTEAI